ncbi:MAG: hypothetical protein ACM3TU_02040 [Bacillota bacterium]
MYHCIGASVGRRASLAAELTAKLAEQDRQDAKTKEHLVLRAPAALRPWLSESMVLDNLYTYGSCSSKINFEECGFAGFTEAKAAVQELRTAWKDVASIKLGDPEPHRVGIWLSALM